LSREKPLAAKYCHCTTCQRLHGVRTIARIETPPSQFFGGMLHPRISS
jgi:hypothetical protein